MSIFCSTSVNIGDPDLFGSETLNDSAVSTPAYATVAASLRTILLHKAREMAAQTSIRRENVEMLVSYSPNTDILDR